MLCCLCALVLWCYSLAAPRTAPCYLLAFGIACLIINSSPGQLRKYFVIELQVGWLI